jgi:WD40 repeat protein
MITCILFRSSRQPPSLQVAYPSGKFVVVRDLSNAKGGFVYRGHNTKVTVAKFSPSGCWVASGDNSGKVRVWAWDSPEHSLKIEIFGIGGAIKDLAWDPENKRIVAVGEGGSSMRCFMWDTGNNLGELTGHTKRVVSVDYRPCRPFKIMSASEDMRTICFKGPPFTLDHSNKEQHTNFVNVVRYSSDGELAATCGSDQEIWLYNGKTGEPTKSLPKSHAGSIYGLSWSPDSSKIMTASADKTCKLWDVAGERVAHTWTLGSQVGDMQCACIWAGESLVSVSLRGDLSCFSTTPSEGPSTVWQGHQVSITALSPTPGEGGQLISGSFDGVVCAWSEDAVARRLKGTDARSVCGAAHSNKVSGLAVASMGVISVGWDDTIRLANLKEGSYVNSVATNGQPNSVAASPSSDVVAVATSVGVAIYRGASLDLVAEISTDYDTRSLDLFGESEVAVGGADSKIHIYSLEGSTLKEVKVIDGIRGAVMCVGYSPDGRYLAAGDTQREVYMWTRGDWEVHVMGLWQFHTSTVMCLAWCPDSTLLATGGQDESVYIWSAEQLRKRIAYKFAHKDGVTGLCWTGEGELVSAGADHCLAAWDVSKDKSAFD